METQRPVEKRGPGKRGPDKQPRAPRGSKGNFIRHPSAPQPKTETREIGHRKEFEATFAELDISIPFYIPEQKKGPPEPEPPKEPRPGEPPKPKNGDKMGSKVYNEKTGTWDEMETTEIPYEPDEKEILRAMRKIEVATIPLGHIFCKIAGRKFNAENYKWTDSELLEYAPAAKAAIQRVNKIITDPKYFYIGFPVQVLQKAWNASEPIKPAE